MAGQPKKQAMIAELTRRATVEGMSVLEYAEQWVASGGTVLGLAAAISASLKLDGEAAIQREMLRRYLVGLEDAAPSTSGALARARPLGAHALAEDAIARADGATKEDAAAVGLQVRARQYLAERWNPAEFGQVKGGTTVNLSIGSLMMEALQAPVPARPVIASVIAEDAEVVSIEPATSSEGE
jgi:hypothetical protein